MAERVVTVEELTNLVAAAGKQTPAIVRSALRAASLAMLRDVQINRLSHQYLGVDTGTGRRTIQQRVVDRGDSIRAEIGSPLVYMRAHEEGFEGAVQVRAHTRRLNSLQVRRGKVTKKSAKAAKRAGGSSTAFVRAHTRQVRMRARRFLRDTVLQEAGKLPGLLSTKSPIEARLVKALRIFFEQGRVPKPGELGV